MGAKKLTTYDIDYIRWINETIALLRENRIQEIDIENLIDELEDMGKSEKRSLESYLENLISHRLKWDFQKSKRSSSWIGTINLAQRKLLKLLKENPSFKSLAENLIQDVYEEGIYLAMADTGLPKDTFPEECPYTLKDLLDFKADTIDSR